MLGVKPSLVRFCVVVLFCSVSFQSPVLRHLVIHSSCNFRQTNFEDFSRIFRGKLQFSRTKFYSIIRQSLTSFWTPYLLNHSMESFTIFTSSAMVDHFILCYFPQQHFAKWLGMTCNCIWGTDRNSIWNKETEIKYCLCTKCFTLPVSFTGSYTEDETNFPRQNIILQKMVSDAENVVNLKDFSFSRPNKEIQDFSRTLTEFKDFSDDY